MAEGEDEEHRTRESGRARRFAAAFSGLWLGVAVASYLKGDWTQNDFERFDDLRLSLLFFALVAALSAAYAALVQRPPRLSRRTVLLAATAWTALLIGSFPVGSKDVFLYASYGRIQVLHGGNPYLVTPADFPGDRWDAFVQHRWRDQPTVYGPLFLAQARLVELVVAAPPWAAVWLHKGLAGTIFPACVWVAGRLRAGPLARGSLALFAWNPLLLFESAGAGHNDIAMVFLLLAALACWRAERRAAALALLAVSFWYKWYALLYLPALALEMWKRGDGRQALRGAAAFVAAGVACGAAALALLPGSADAIMQQLLHPAVVQGIYPHEISPVPAALFWPMRAVGLCEWPLDAAAFDVARCTLFGVVALAVLARQARAPQGLEALLQSGFLLGAGFFSLMVTMLFPWHLLTVVALGLLCERRGFVVAAAAISILALLSYFLTFAVAAVLFAAVGAALWLLRRSA